jgi:hypothetical protein
MPRIRQRTLEIFSFSLTTRLGARTFVRHALIYMRIVCDYEVVLQIVLKTRGSDDNVLRTLHSEHKMSGTRTTPIIVQFKEFVRRRLSCGICLHRAPGTVQPVATNSSSNPVSRLLYIYKRCHLTFYLQSLLCSCDGRSGKYIRQHHSSSVCRSIVLASAAKSRLPTEAGPQGCNIISTLK